MRQKTRVDLRSGGLQMNVRHSGGVDKRGCGVPFERGIRAEDVRSETSDVESLIL